MTQRDSSAAKKPLWKSLIKPAGLIAVGIIVAVPLFSIT
jgi:hypothetical protein